MLASKMVGRGSLSETGRAAIRRELSTIYNQKKGFYDASRSYWRNIGEMMDLDPVLLERDLSIPAGGYASGVKKSGFDPEDL